MPTREQFYDYITNLADKDEDKVKNIIKKLWGKKSVLRGNWDSLTLYAIDWNRYWWRAFLMYCFDNYKEKLLSLLPPTK